MTTLWYSQEQYELTQPSEGAHEIVLTQRAIQDKEHEEVSRRQRIFEQAARPTTPCRGFSVAVTPNGRYVPFTATAQTDFTKFFDDAVKVHEGADIDVLVHAGGVNKHCAKRLGLTGDDAKVETILSKVDWTAVKKSPATQRKPAPVK